MTGGEFKAWAALVGLFVVLPAVVVAVIRVFVGPEEDETRAAALRTGLSGELRDMLGSLGRIVGWAFMLLAFALWAHWDDKKEFGYMLGEAFASAFFATVLALIVLWLSDVIGIWLKPKWDRITNFVYTVTFVGAGLAVLILQHYYKK